MLGLSTGVVLRIPSLFAEALFPRRYPLPKLG
ncbi:uncharacterized protein METZ01_LOCUS13832 [marine metagenome]|uniref:Uncharacterized protein n=1 Tax=marine metagenome TaxID=408172 RepID=A0A381P438_9ZZZZ